MHNLITIPKGVLIKDGHKIIIESFKISPFTVTEAEYALFDKNRVTENPTHPVVNISYHEAEAYAKSLGCRLPTELEWEYACLAGSSGPISEELDHYAWYVKNSDEKLHPIGQKRPNKWGLYDMLGNVWEWCQTEEPYKYLKGGSYWNYAWSCRSAYRAEFAPFDQSLNIGFRLAADI